MRNFYIDSYSLLVSFLFSAFFTLHKSLEVKLDFITMLLIESFRRFYTLFRGGWGVDVEDMTEWSDALNFLRRIEFTK